MPVRNTAGRERAAALLLADPCRSNTSIVAQAGLSFRLVQLVRAELERSGAIPAPVPSGHDRKIAGLCVQPYIPDLPHQPDLSQGKCARHPHPDWWAPGAGQPEREAARHVCGTCPVLEPCRQWSLNLPAMDTSVYAGQTTNERIRARRERHREAAEAQAQPWGHAAANAVKTHCDQGHPLAGDNVRITTRPDGRTKRICRTCHRLQVARAARVARAVQRDAISETRRARYQRDRDRILARQRAAYARRKARQAAA